MGRNLVIVESPAKVETINKILGKDFVVKASMGHVRDLPEKKLGVDIEEGFEPQYVTLPQRKDVIADLKKIADSAEQVYLAPDPDREGESIAWHLAAALKGKKASDEKFFRVTHNEITASGIRNAFEHPVRIDMNKVDAQQARRVLDRIVGYKVSPLLRRRIKGGSSAGRVQSVALRLVCEREQEIESFVPEEYWLVGARVRKQVDPRAPFQIRLVKINDEKPDIKNAEQAEKIRQELEQCALNVAAIKLREISKKARAPFITSTLQQSASTVLGYTPSRTMGIAQKLYEAGTITYMRTDSVAIAKEAQAHCLRFVEEKYGNEYVPTKPNVYKSRSSAQEAHEAIRPTDVTRIPDKLKSTLPPDEFKLYRIIRERFVASQMAPARIAQRSVDIAGQSGRAGGNRYLFRVSTSDILFPGYMKVSGMEKNKKPKAKTDAAKDGVSEEEDEAEKLPPLTEGEPLDCEEWLTEQKFTQPPPRYNEASLVRTLEENGVGRPSTYAQILSTLYQREYIEKEKKALRPTEPGKAVNEFLVSHLNQLFEVGFTAGMEKTLDDIEQGKINWKKMLEDFYGNFTEWVDKAKGPTADVQRVRQLLEISKGIKEWAPPTTRGKKTYSDETFVASIAEQLEKGEKDISMRQLDALKKVVCRYHDQLPGLDEKAEEWGLQEILGEARKPKEPPREETFRKIALLQNVQFAEARKVGKRTYDDKAFCDSLREQVGGGKRLSVNQVKYLDQLVIKYSDQIENFPALSSQFGLEQALLEEDKESGPVLKLFAQVQAWKEPTQRGKKTWDDKGFYDSLKQQFTEKKKLSPRQLAALKKMAKRYADQIPDYDAIREQYGLPERGKKKEQEK